MLSRLLMIIVLMLISSLAISAEENQTAEDTHVHIENGVVYCDVQTFNQESYILKVLGGGSPLTVVWQFDVMEENSYWMSSSIAQIRLGRQVLSDLVTKRWLMRDLSSGIVHYTTDIRKAMRFLTEMNHAPIVDVSVLDAGDKYNLETTLYMYEGEQEDQGWWISLTQWGEDMGSVPLLVQKGIELE